MSAGAAALEIESQVLRVRIDPRAMRVDVCDRSGALVLEGLRPEVAAGPDAVPSPRGSRVHAVGEVRGPTGPAARVEMQVWERHGIGLRWVVEVPRNEAGVAASLSVENRGSETLRLQALHPLSIQAGGDSRIHLGGPVASERIPLTEHPRGGEPLESLLLLELGGDLAGLLGFTTARLSWTRWELERRDSEVTLLRAVNALDDRSLAPGQVIESDRAWLTVGPARGELLLEWARRTGVEMSCRVPRRGAISWSAGEKADLPPDLQRDEIQVFEAPAATDLASCRWELARAREELEPGALLVASRSPFGASVGLADARSADRSGPPGARDLDLAFTNQRLWLLAPGPLRVADGSLADARTRASIAGLAGGLITLADDLDSLDDERLALLRCILPPLARQVDVSPARGVLVTPLAAGRLAVLLLNLEEERAGLSIPFRLLGRRGPFHGFDFWENRPLGLLHDCIPPRGVEPGGCRVVGLTPLSDRAQVIGSSLHIGMGTLEVASLRPLERQGHLLSMRLSGSHRGDVWIAEPQSTTAERVPVEFCDAGQFEVVPKGP